MQTGPRVDLALLLLLSALWHAAWAGAAPIAEYADAFYYEAVARAIVSGEGAQTGALWNLQHLPPSLPHAADLHWMPLPSRWLVPFVALWPDGGAFVASVLAACLWAPSAYAMAQALGSDRSGALLAGGFALLAGEAVRDVSMPDSFALAGALGALQKYVAAEGAVTDVYLYHTLRMIGSALQSDRHWFSTRLEKPRIQVEKLTSA